MSKSCKDFKEIISEYVDGELLESEMNECNAHAESCSSCGSELRMIKKALAVLKVQEKVKAPANFTISLKTRISSEVNVSKSYKSFLIKVIGILLISTLSFAVVYNVMEHSVEVVINKKPQTKNHVVVFESKDSNDVVVKDTIKISETKIPIQSKPPEKQIVLPKIQEADTLKLDSSEVSNDTTKSAVLNIQGRSLLNGKMGTGIKNDDSKNAQSPIQVSIALYPWKSKSNITMYQNSYEIIQGLLQEHGGTFVIPLDSLSQTKPYSVNMTLPIKDYEIFLKSCGELGNVDRTDEFIKLNDIGFITMSISVYYISM